jgi:D-alanyl-lipoteichoic acid acyltransferase DltB (MBOAT superfamily)
LSLLKPLSFNLFIPGHAPLCIVPLFFLYKIESYPIYVALYIFLFPQLIAGPIVRYSTVEYEIENSRENWTGFSEGLRRFVFGLAKKVIIANQAGFAATAVLSQDAGSIGSGMMWLAVFSYAIQNLFRLLRVFQHGYRIGEDVWVPKA